MININDNNNEINNENNNETNIYFNNILIKRLCIKAKYLNEHIDQYRQIVNIIPTYFRFDEISHSKRQTFSSLHLSSAIQHFNDDFFTYIPFIDENNAEINFNRMTNIILANSYNEAIFGINGKGGLMSLEGGKWPDEIDLLKGKVEGQRNSFLDTETQISLQEY